MELQRQVDWLGGEPARFDGKTIDPAIDGDRLGRQMNAVFAAMKNGDWWTLRGLANVSAGTEAGVSARIRDLRKRRFGGYTVLRRRVRAGLWEYRLITHDFKKLYDESFPDGDEGDQMDELRKAALNMGQP